MSYIYVIKTHYPPELMKRIHGEQTETITKVQDVKMEMDDLIDALELEVIQEGVNFK